MRCTLNALITLQPRIACTLWYVAAFGGSVARGPILQFMRALFRNSWPQGVPSVMPPIPRRELERG